VSAQACIQGCLAWTWIHGAMVREHTSAILFWVIWEVSRRGRVWADTIYIPVSGVNITLLSLSQQRTCCTAAHACSHCMCKMRMNTTARRICIYVTAGTLTASTQQMPARHRGDHMQLVSPFMCIPPRWHHMSHAATIRATAPPLIL
jgi:hypothetical protein